MPEITREYFQSKRAEYVEQLNLVRGALAALDEIEKDLFPAPALTMDELKQSVGAKEIGQPEPINNGAGE